MNEAGNSYEIEACATIVPGPCESVWWGVCEYDPNTNDCVPGTRLGGSQWDQCVKFETYQGTELPSPTQQAYRFGFGKYYLIERGTWGDCHSWVSSKAIVSKLNPQARLINISPQQFQRSRAAQRDRH